MHEEVEEVHVFPTELRPIKPMGDLDFRPERRVLIRSPVCTYLPYPMERLYLDFTFRCTNGIVSVLLGPTFVFRLTEASKPDELTGFETVNEGIWIPVVMDYPDEDGERAMALPKHIPRTSSEDEIFEHTEYVKGIYFERIVRDYSFCLILKDASMERSYEGSTKYIPCLIIDREFDPHRVY